MIECPFCWASCPANALSCSVCGTQFSEKGKGVTQTDPLSELPEEIGALLLARESEPIAVRLSISGLGRQVVLPLGDDIYVGRADPTLFFFPDVDLTEDRGQVAGVSRRHARLFKQDGVVKIEDLGSMNGTFVNRLRLSHHRPVRLSHGDYLQLGRIIIQVLFEDEEELLQKGRASEPGAREAYLEQRVGHLFDLYEGGLCYLEWIPPESAAQPKSLTRFIGELLPLPRLGATLIGRHPDAALQLASRKVSGHHCRVFFKDYQFFIEDLDSTNGTFVQKVKLVPQTPKKLRHGDSIRVGDVQLFFQDRLVALLAEIKLSYEQQIVIEALQGLAGQHPEAGLYMLTRTKAFFSRADLYE